MKIFYHNDMDGRCAAFWVNHTAQYVADYTEMDYSKPFPIETIIRNEKVWILDYSIDPSVMSKLLEITENVIWIDHHITAIDNYKNFNVPIGGMRKNGIAACALTYAYVSNEKESAVKQPVRFTKNLLKRMPRFVKLIADRDVWKYKYGETTECFHLGASAYDCSPKSDFWRDCMKKSFVNKVIREGHVIQKYQVAVNADYLKMYSFECELAGYKCIALNHGRGALGAKYFNGKGLIYDVMLLFAWNGIWWTVSLYTEKENIDVSKIAEKFGGGGHKTAAGFKVKGLHLYNRSLSFF